MAIGAVAKQLAGRFLKRGGKDIIMGSVPGALATTAMSTVTTGNPLAGALVGGTDLVASSLLARGLGSRTISNQLSKLAGGTGTTAKIAGKVQQALPGRYVGGPGVGNRQYMLSTPQSVATSIGSVGAAISLEPYFYPKQEAAVLAEQYPQLAGQPVDQSQMITQAQQLAQLKQQNNLGQEANSPGTMYQLQGMPLATDPGIDTYRLSRGQL